MNAVKRILGIFLATSLIMIGWLIYDAVAGGGGAGSWILAVVWFVGMILIVGAGLRSIANR